MYIKVILKKRARINDEMNADSSPENVYGKYFDHGPCVFRQPNVNIISRVRVEFSEDPCREKSLLDKLLSVLKDSPDQMTDNDIREEMDTFFFAGLNKSSTAITMTLLLLGMHRNVQVRF